MKSQLKTIIKKTPVVGTLGSSVWAKLNPRNVFPGSGGYWESRYQSGGTSGAGSYGRLAEFKAEVLNPFVAEQKIQSLMEFGCGDGNQLSLASYPNYIGLDVSRQAITICRERFAGDDSKSFFLYDPFCFVDNHQTFQTDATLSLDVIYHLIEDEVYERYMAHLFNASRRWVIIYSSDRDGPAEALSHVRQRRFSSWIEENAPAWSLWRKLENRYPSGDEEPISEPDEQSTSWADFYFYRRDESDAAPNP